jgi:hypothetical protein
VTISRRVSTWLLAALPIALAVLVYRPWRLLPFDMWDFADFLPVISHLHGAMSQYGALLHYYAQDGRMNAVFYLTFVAQFTAFGFHSGDWQLLRFVVMAFDLCLLFAVMRKMGVRPVAAAGALGLLAMASPALRAWLQLMAEPMALAALLAGVWVALDFGVTPHWRRSVAVIMALVACTFLSKEVDGALGLMVLLVAVFWPQPGRERAPLFSRRNVALALGVALVAAGEAVLLLIVRAQPHATGYGMAYGSAPLSLAALGSNLIAMLMPVRPAGGAAIGLAYPANVLAILVVVLALLAAVREQRDRRSLVIKVALGLLPAVLGALIYWPWPDFHPFYVLPFFVGPIFLYAGALDVLLKGSRFQRSLAILAAVVAPLYAAIPASRSTEIAAASLRLNANFAVLLPHFHDGDTLVVLDPVGVSRALPVEPPLLRKYAVSLGLFDDTTHAPLLRAVACDAYGPGSSAAVPAAIVSYSYGCGQIRHATVHVIAPYVWRDWLTLARVDDTLSLDFAGPLVADRLLGQRVH